MTGYVECPGCRVQYPAQKLYSEASDRPAPGRVYTVVCAVCGHQFDVSFKKRRFPAMPFLRHWRAIFKG